MIGLKILRQPFNQLEAKVKPIAPSKRQFSRILRKVQVTAKNFDFFITLFALIVIGSSNYFGIGYSTIIGKLAL